MDLKHFLLLGAPGIIVIYFSKHDDTRSISRQEHNEFYPSSGAQESNNPMSSLVVLLYGF
jgi:hypothetical protein